MTSLIQNQPAFSFIHTFFNRFRINENLFTPGKQYTFHLPQTDNIRTATVIAKKAIINENGEKAKRTDELIGAYNQSNKGEEFLKEYIHGLEEMMFMTHHKVRQPVANILGMASLIEKHTNSPDDMKKIVEFMKQSALDLDAFTRELTTFISDLEQKGKNKNR